MKQQFVNLFYIVVDVSNLNGQALDAANMILPALVDAVALEPALSDKVRVGLMDFADDARVQLPICDILDPSLAIPILRVRVGTSYEAVFRMLRNEIDSNVKQFKSDGFLLHRPVVFFLANGGPSDPTPAWEVAFSGLVNNRSYPFVVPFGAGYADGRVLQHLIYPPTGSRAMVMYLASRDEDTATAIARSADIMIASIMKSAREGFGVLLPSTNAVPGSISIYDASDIIRQGDLPGTGLR